MKLPRDISGADLSQLLQRYGYSIVRQTGSHIRLTSVKTGTEHHITIPAHAALKVGTLNAILRDIAEYLKVDRDLLTKELFGR